ncbi:30S ribosomal protein S17 [Candidatus Dependentiae bacterium]
MVKEKEQKKQKRLYRGIVVSDKMGKTVVVKTERDYKHLLLGKVMRAAKKYKVHDEKMLAKTGDVVEFYEGRPTSKTKFMYLERVVKSSSALK